MKKIISMLLCLVMLLGITTAVAETATADKVDLGSITVNGKFALKAKLPEGYTAQIFQVSSDSGYLVASIQCEDKTKPKMELHVFYSVTDLSKLERLNDATDEQLAAIEDTFREQDVVDITYTETGLGTKLLVAKEIEDTTDWVSVFTVYKGYCIEFMLEPGDEAAEDHVTDEQVQKAIEFLTDLDFEPIA